MRLGEIERRVLHGANFTSGDQRGVDGSEAGGVELKNVGEDVAGAFAFEIEVAVIGEIGDGGLVGDGGVVDLEFVFVVG